jgi:hypothetical protein
MTCGSAPTRQGANSRCGHTRTRITFPRRSSPNARQRLEQQKLWGLSSWDVRYIKDYADAPLWLDTIAGHYLILEQVQWELLIAKAELKAERVAAEIAKLESDRDDYHYAKQERKRAKKAVAFLKADLAYSKWGIRKYLGYCINMHKDGAPGRRDAAPFNNIKAGLAEKRAMADAGPEPVIPKPPKGFRRQLCWDQKNTLAFNHYF